MSLKIPLTTPILSAILRPVLCLGGVLAGIAIGHGCNNQNKTVENRPAQETVIDFGNDPALRRNQFVPNAIDRSNNKRTEFEARPANPFQ